MSFKAKEHLEKKQLPQMSLHSYLWCFKFYKISLAKCQWQFHAIMAILKKTHISEKLREL